MQDSGLEGFEDELIAEVSEQVDIAETKNLDYPEEGKDEETLEHLFRIFHNVKGAVAMIGHESLVSLFHNLESQLATLNQSTEQKVLDKNHFLNQIDIARKKLTGQTEESQPELEVQTLPEPTKDTIYKKNDEAFQQIKLEKKEQRNRRNIHIKCRLIRMRLQLLDSLLAKVETSKFSELDQHQAEIQKLGTLIHSMSKNTFEQDNLTQIQKLIRKAA